MLEYLKTQAVVLTVSPRNESGAIISCYTRQAGSVAAVANGLKKIRSKLASSMLPGNVVYITLVKKTNWHITGAIIVRPLAVLLAEPDVFRLGLVIREVMDNFIPSIEKDETIFNNLVVCLAMLASRHYSLEQKESITYRFLLSLFKRQGVLPNWNICQHDGKKILPNGTIYWYKPKGVICLSCKKHYEDSDMSKISPKLKTMFIDRATTKELLFLDELARKQCQKIINDIYEQEVSRPLYAWAKN